MSSAPLLPQEILRRKRDGAALTAEEIAFLVEGWTRGTVSDAQVGAFAMAVFLRGMTMRETVDLTHAMTQSGRVLAWDLDGPILDKHSTGGVGDKVSLVLAPVVAACGGFVPMVSGRGLGHTGGTLDKLDSIPGYDTTPDVERFRNAVREAGCAIVGQTEALAPADDILYAIRDVTATVASIPLITASILSKKLAEGLQGLVMDVKFGSGAFSATPEDARALAASIIDVAAGAGLPTTALLTDMNQVLGRSAGNAVEVHETLDVLRGDAPDERLRELVVALAADMLVLGGIHPDLEAARDAAEAALASGRAAERFAAMTTALGGPSDLLSAPDRHLPKAPVRHAVEPAHPGVVQSVDARALGLVTVQLGGGRRHPNDTIDHAVGLTAVLAPGEETDAFRPLAVVHARKHADAAWAARRIREVVGVGEEPPPPRPLVRERMTEQGG
ncbi:MAG: thymidine phosphorylase [Planctomycetota bacterium]